MEATKFVEDIDYREMEDTAIDYFLSIIDHRSKELFSVFLKEGYRKTTFSFVDPKYYSRLQYCKLLLGMRITALDDLADNPEFYNPDLLHAIYAIPYRDANYKPPFLSDRDEEIFELVCFLQREISTEIIDLPNYENFRRLFETDMELTDLATKMATNITYMPELANLQEMRILGPYNMGMVAAATLDLMAAKRERPLNIGVVREAAHIGQRLGRIANLLTTLDRELREGDQTNEILLFVKNHQDMGFPLQTYSDQLRDEFEEGLQTLTKITSKQTQESASAIESYRQSLIELYHLHVRLQAKI